ncbi:blastoderm-specific protein 25D isoform X2 [Uranotaenia lowii]|uniref:blastoderm-specific protein 25D isoform X2 n=1 Tax=Uranotaenia lowii TaxID=190385 RepID=UPI00247AE1CD|nr:blastoderm-specific protein 25D isoform X2 [Uranotaenia lowii]
MLIILYATENGQNIPSESPTAATLPSGGGSDNSNAATSPTSIRLSSKKRPPHLTCRISNSSSPTNAAVVETADGQSVIIGSGNQKKMAPSGDSVSSSMQLTTTTTTGQHSDNDDEHVSSDREVSPKFVVGTKKYGRRSRPRTDDCNGLDSGSDVSNSDNESVPQQQQQQQSSTEDGKNNSSKQVQRSASQSDIHGSKRKRPLGVNRLKRCASLPTHRQRPDLVNRTLINTKNVRDQLNMDETIDKKIYFMRLSENLREVWDSLLDGGHGDLLNRGQLEVVCERVGLQKLPAKLAAQEVFTKLSLQPIEGISFDEFISLLQSDSDILPIGGGINNGGIEGGGVSPMRRLYDESDTFKAQELDRDSVEETVGFTVRMPDWTAEIGSLSAAIILDMWESAGIVEPRALLHELGFYGAEIQVADLVTALEDEQQRLGDGGDTSSIMRALLALHKAEVAALRQAFVQLVDENKKLYSDNKEVNQRAVLLAQEIDERHNSLETSTRNKIRLLEQRHHETVKEMTEQLALEREQLTCANALLEKRIRALEADEGRLKTEMGRLSDENDGLRVEQESLTKELTEILEKNIKLNRDIAELEENNRNDFDDESFGRKDDREVLELIEKISLLQSENTELRDKSDEQSAEIEMLSAELARFKLKRSVVNRTSSLEVSPVVVEVTGGVDENASAARKRQGDSPSKARLSDESPRLGKFRKCSNDTENESDSSGDWMALQSELGIRGDCAINPASGVTKEVEVRQLKSRIVELEKKLEERKVAEGTTEPDEKGATGGDQDKFKARCAELEASLEQMSKEYEACEDYWQAKVNEERQLFEEEQRVSDDKFNELLKKMAELEEQFAGQGGSKSEDGRLSPIEEKDILEQQYLDLELELQQSQLMLEEKTHEVDKLRNRILELEKRNKYHSDALLSSSPRVASPEMDSPASSPISYLWNQSTIQAPVAARDYHNPNWCQQLKLSSTQIEITRNGTESEEKLSSSLSSIPTAARSSADDHHLLSVPGDAGAGEDLAAGGFSRTISPIQKPIAAPTAITSSMTDVGSCGAVADNQDLVDCSDVCSVKSVKSTHSLASTYSIHKSVSQTDVAMASQEQLKQLHQLQEEIKDLTHQRDCLKVEFQQLNEVKPILARGHPNLGQKVHHLEQKNRQLQAMLKQQQVYSEQFMHQIWQQQRGEVSELRNRLEAQNILITEQANRLTNNDILVKELYVENSHLVAQVQRLEQQKARANLLQQLSQASAQAAAAAAQHPHHHQAAQLSGMVPGLP